MARPEASEVASMLADRAEAVCRRYLPEGRKCGNYWMVGDATGASGKSMHVRLRGPLSGNGAAGRWSDEATGDHGNLLDVIRLSQGLSEFRDVLAEASRFLSLPIPETRPVEPSPVQRHPGDGRAFAGRLFTASRSLAGSLAETHLRNRGIDLQPDFTALRFHPRCFHGRGEDGQPVYWPAMVAAVTDMGGALTGISRTYLALDGLNKAPVDPQRRAKGDIRGNGIRFGDLSDVMAAGEGIETTLSLRAAMPALPLVAATSANHLAALLFPANLRTLLVIRDNDHAGDAATDALFARGRAAGIDLVLIDPERDDLNSDLMHLGRGRLVHRVREQIPQALVERFMV